MSESGLWIQGKNVLQFIIAEVANVLISLRVNGINIIDYDDHYNRWWSN